MSMQDIGLRELIYQLLPRPRAMNASRFNPQKVMRVLVLLKGKNPTFTYYLEERLRRLSVPVTIRNHEDGLDDIDPKGTFIILCRYVGIRQLWWTFKSRGNLAGISLLIDDDVNATVVDPQADLGYRLYLMALAVAPLPLLNRMLTHVWASTHALAERLGTQDRVDPLPPAHAFQSSATSQPDPHVPVLMVFHATGNHRAEHLFLRPIVEEAMRRFSTLRFEVIAKGRSASVWADAKIDRTRMVVNGMRPWNDYLRQTADTSADIALVPLIASRVNAARSDTKRIDACRMSAAPIFSSGPIYERCRVTGEILADNKPAEWLSAIGMLVENANTRTAAKAATAQSIGLLISAASTALPGLECLQKNENCA